MAEQVPYQDGSGVIDAEGRAVHGVAASACAAGFAEPPGSARRYGAGYVVRPDGQDVPLPDRCLVRAGASSPLGMPAVTSHRTLAVADGGADGLAPGALSGKTVLVAGGAGSVGNAAIQLARWAGHGDPTAERISRPFWLRGGRDHVVTSARRRRRAGGGFTPEGVDVASSGLRWPTPLGSQMPDRGRRSPSRATARREAFRSGSR